MELSKMSNLNTFGAQLSDFWRYVAKIGKYTKTRVWAFKVSLRFSNIISSQFVHGFGLEICLAVI